MNQCVGGDASAAQVPEEWGDPQGSQHTEGLSGYGCVSWDVWILKAPSLRY